MKIAIIAGHSSTTAGKRTPPFINPVDIDGDGSYDVFAGEQYREHYANVGVSVALDEALRRCDFETYKVGWDDEDATDDTLGDDSAGLAKRQALVKAAGCDISVSNHFNAYGDGTSFNSADGVCTYIHSNAARVGDSAALADLVQARLIEGTVQRDRGVHADAFAEVNCAAMGTKAAVLVEHAFMTNQHEAETMMANKAFWIESAEEICRAVCEYAGVAYVEREEDEDMTGEEIFNKLSEYLSSLGTSDYAKESSEKGVKSKVFSDGDKDGLVDNPQGILRRQELAVVLNRLGLLK